MNLDTEARTHMWMQTPVGAAEGKAHFETMYNSLNIDKTKPVNPKTLPEKFPKVADTVWLYGFAPGMRRAARLRSSGQP